MWYRKSAEVPILLTHIQYVTVLQQYWINNKLRQTENVWRMTLTLVCWSRWCPDDSNTHTPCLCRCNTCISLHVSGPPAGHKASLHLERWCWRGCPYCRAEARSAGLLPAPSSGPHLCSMRNLQGHSNLRSISFHILVNFLLNVLLRSKLLEVS